MEYAAGEFLLDKSNGWRPVYQWGRFAQSWQEGVAYLEKAIFPIIMERYDESLVLLRAYLNWPDHSIIYAGKRQAYRPTQDLSEPIENKQPKWSLKALHRMNRTLIDHGDWKMYTAALRKFEELSRRFSDVTGSKERDLVQTQTQAYRETRERLAQKCSEKNSSLMRETWAALNNTMHHVTCTNHDGGLCSYTNGGAYVIDVKTFCTQRLYQTLRASGDPSFLVSWKSLE
eukprot:CAMPEP_0185754236 /NCGR_PEP_ID=MMETSP1174-20130828/12875_1 /TAXON_ID=35687 /ORGANISM="Dictyocha speculum, Strain CCMP1381" /LENGTH=229 /DNA_ID=CAMNT_0028432359 /DNA_START=223 /DNA_END=912 /DNA_ORIENTATION=-